MMGSAALEHENKPFSPLSDPASPKRRSPTTAPTSPKHHLWDQKETRGIGLGLALIDSLSNDSEKSPTAAKQERKLVMFGSQLKIKVPPSLPLPDTTLVPSNSPSEFGTKTPRSKFMDCGIQLVGSSLGSNGEGGLSVEEMELSEDYTCVISHGPNPKTTRIFGNCVVESSCCSEVRSPAAAKRTKEVLSSWSENWRSSSKQQGKKFLRFCHHCKVELGHGKDIYMSRGEKAFCSQECRCKEMCFDAADHD